jgi:hypothetical protein
LKTFPTLAELSPGTFMAQIEVDDEISTEVALEKAWSGPSIWRSMVIWMRRSAVIQLNHAARVFNLAQSLFELGFFRRYFAN